MMQRTHSRLRISFALLLGTMLLVLGGAAFAEPPLTDSATGKIERFPFITESGGIVGMGTGSIPEGNYQPILLIWHLAADLRHHVSSLKNHRGTLSVICEPQVNPVFDPRTDIEFGVGVGLKYMYPVTDRLSPYIMGSVGPHYISVQTEKQASGFIFADTIGAGIYYFLDKKSALNIGYRFRHVSNADLKSPNGGIDTQIGTIGYSVFF